MGLALSLLRSTEIDGGAFALASRFSQVRSLFSFEGLDYLGALLGLDGRYAHLVAGPRRRRRPPVTSVVSNAFGRPILMNIDVALLDFSLIVFKFFIFCLNRKISSWSSLSPSGFVQMGWNDFDQHSSSCGLELFFVSLSGSWFLAHLFWSCSPGLLLDWVSRLFSPVWNKMFQPWTVFCQAEVSSEGRMGKLTGSSLNISLDRAKICAEILVFIPRNGFGYAKPYCCCAIAVKRGRPSIFQHLNSVSDLTFCISLLAKLLVCLTVSLLCNLELMYLWLHY